MAKLLLPTLLSLLLLPAFADALDIRAVKTSLLRFQRSFERPRSAARRILQLRGSDLDFVAGTTLYDHECWTELDLEDCTYNTRVLLASDAPEPQSAAGRWLAKLIGATFSCEQHATFDACMSDEANDCMVSTEVNVVNNTLVQVCTSGEFSRSRIVNDYFLCPGSIMQKMYKCQLLSDLTSDLTTNNTCPSGDGVTCQLSPAKECLPKDLIAAYDLTDELVVRDVTRAMNNVSHAMWGCCPGVAMYRREAQCNAIVAEKECTGDCKWFGDETEQDLMREDEPPCGLRRDAIRNIVMQDVNSKFANYLKQAQAKCKALATANVTAAQCMSSGPIRNLSSTKAETFANFRTVLGGGPAPATCPPDTALSPSPPLFLVPTYGMETNQTDRVNETSPAPPEGAVGSTNSTPPAGTNGTLLSSGQLKNSATAGTSGADNRWACGVAMLALTVAAVASL